MLVRLRVLQNKLFPLNIDSQVNITLHVYSKEFYLGKSRKNCRYVISIGLFNLLTCGKTSKAL